MLLPAIARRWYQALEQTLATYQFWNAFYLNPQHYRQAAHCYATMQQTLQQAGHRCCRRADGVEHRLDRLAVALETLSRAELATLIAALDRGRWLTQAAAISTMSDAELEHVMADLEAAAYVHRSGALCACIADEEAESGALA